MNHLSSNLRIKNFLHKILLLCFTKLQDINSTKDSRVSDKTNRHFCKKCCPRHSVKSDYKAAKDLNILYFEPSSGIGSIKFVSTFDFNPRNVFPFL